MPRSKYQVIAAIFDIKPVNENGEIDVVKVSSIEPLLNLGRKLRIGKNGKMALKNQKAPTDVASSKLVNSVGAARSAFSPVNHPTYSLSRPKLKSRENVDNQKPRFDRAFDSVEDRGFAPLDPRVINQGRHYASPTVAPAYQEKIKPQEELETYLNEDIDSKAELAAIGAEVFEKKDAEPRYMPIFTKQKSAKLTTSTEILGFTPEPSPSDGATTSDVPTENYQDILHQINQKIAPAVPDMPTGEPKRTGIMDWWQEKLKTTTLKRSGWSGRRMTESEKLKVEPSQFKDGRRNLATLKKLSSKKIILGALALMMMGLLTEYGFSIKNEIVHSGNSAVNNLESAGENIKKLDFTSASTNFAQAYADFAQAGDSLNFMGATISSLIADLPGGSKLKSAKNLVEAGKLMADAGQAMTLAMEELSKTNTILFSSDVRAGSSASIGNISKDLRQALVLSQKNIKEAKELLKKVDSDSLPEDKKASFEEFRSELPEFEKLITDAVDYSKFLEDLIGTAGTKKYLLLFQNPAELRPTGGFPGSYGIVVFKDGKLQDFRVDDVYNLDGQLKELYVPPVQLQHIVPNWAMRDVNWFVDFPASARKITEFYKKESGEDVDGIITFSPKIVSRILEITGPIRMDKYNVTLDAGNFSQAIQDEVEYKADKNQPKKILVDLAPLMLEEIYSADSDRWMEIFNILVSSVDGKDIFMYFRDLKLQDFSVTKGFSGQVNQTQDDYLMVTLTNVKGSKTDSVMDSQLKMDTIFEGDDVRHRLVLTRTHNGGGTKYGFWNKQAPSYVRILVPDNAQFLGISGNSRPNFKPLLDYPNTDFKRDEDLVRFEEKSYYDGESGVTTYEESGKREYGFWMIINPGETKSIELEYRVPGKSAGKEYEFYLQKQSGLEFNKFELNLVSGMAEISQSSVELKKGDGKYTFSGKLDRDLPVKVIFK